MMMKKFTILLLVPLLLAACGKSRTEKKIWDKKWMVYNVTPPATGSFDVEASNRAKDLKAGFYKDAWFRFGRYGLFSASFGGKVDSGKYTISYDGKIISLYPLKGNKMYEQLRIQKITKDELDFNTLIANFHMTLHTKSVEEEK